MALVGTKEHAWAIADLFWLNLSFNFLILISEPEIFDRRECFHSPFYITVGYLILRGKGYGSVQYGESEISKVPRHR